jgi:membrane protease YdiL (CAAX protease family)
MVENIILHCVGLRRKAFRIFSKTSDSPHFVAAFCQECYDCESSLSQCLPKMSYTPLRLSLSVPWGLRDILLGLAIVAAVWLTAVLIISITGIVVVRLGILFYLLAFVLEGTMLLTAVLLGPARRRSGISSLGFRWPIGRGRVFLPLIVAALSIVFSALYALTMQILGQDALVPPSIPAELRQSWMGIPGFILTVLFGPLAEETFFRGFIFPSLLNHFGLAGAVATSSILFALSHGSIALMIPTLFAGVLLCLLYVWTRSLWSVWQAHALQNAIAFMFVPM